MAPSHRLKPFFRFMVICAIIFGANNSYEMNVTGASTYPSLDGWYIDRMFDNSIMLIDPNRIKKQKGSIIEKSLMVNFKENAIWNVSHEINCFNYQLNTPTKRGHHHKTMNPRSALRFRR